MRHVAVTLALAITAVLVAAPRPADACSCSDLLRITPADGAVDVPVNVEIVVDTGPVGSPAGGPPPYVLAGPDGPVEIEYERIVEQWTYSIDLIRPLEPLAPMTDYVLSDGDEQLWPDVESGDTSPDLTNCNDPAPEPPPESSGCSTMPATGLAIPLAAVFLLACVRRKRIVALAAIASAGVLLTAPRPADACSCIYELRVMPGDGETDVPTNTVIVVRNRPMDSEAALTLEGPDGAVAVETELVLDQPYYRVELIAPRTELEPNMEYTLRGLPADIGFTTGAGPDELAPEPVVLGELALARADYADAVYSCGNEYSFVDLAIAPPDDAAAIELTVTTGGQTTRYLIDSEHFGWGLSNTDQGCGMRIPLEAGAYMCFSVRARDAAGNLSAPVERCATVTACADIEDGETFDGDLSDCEPAPPRGSGCSTTSPTGLVLPLAAMLFLAGRRRARR